MPLSVIKYSAVTAKIKAMYSKLLTSDQYDILMTKHSVGEIVAWLKESPGYSNVLSVLNENSVHRGDFEKVFQVSLLSDGEKIAKMLGRNERNLLNLLLSSYEYEELKLIIRSIRTGDKIPQSVFTVYDKVHIGKSKNLDLWKCYESRNMAELVDNLRGTKYYSLLRVYAADGSDATPLDIEMSMDAHYLLRLVSATKDYLSRSEMKNAEDFFGREIDILNLMWIYRCRKYYKFTREGTLNHIIPFNYKMSKDDVYKLAGSSTDEFKEIARSSKYGSIFAPEDDMLWDQKLTEYLYKLYRRHFTTDMFSFTTVLAYIYLKGIDINNIITIIEAVRYGLNATEIKKYLTVIR
ncbi:MAG: V-type ATPase subunit [Clostridiales bacterium]|jgi:V/A-type H+-transporting ATPase subunit C|nr:V-type ATPase subunit [Clostridiales bacterium]